MKELNITAKIMVCDYSELTEDEKNLIDLAKNATNASYAPYSKFYVGAALLLDNGKVITGSNQENASFPVGTCAERSCIYAASSQYPGVRFGKLAIAARNNGSFVPSPVAPCGMCRQAILEFETIFGTPIEILLYGESSIYKVASIKDLLPLCFSEF